MLFQATDMCCYAGGNSRERASTSAGRKLVGRGKAPCGVAQAKSPMALVRSHYYILGGIRSDTHRMRSAAMLGNVVVASLTTARRAPRV
jgi:hypothetical protein